jgi:hypothetical protein
VREALASLPWVDKDTIQTDIKTQIVKFTVKDANQFNLDQVKQVLAAKAKRFADVKLISGPGEGAPATRPTTAPGTKSATAKGTAK